MGQEAVALGLLSEEAYERNRGSYLNRSYARHEESHTGLGRWVSQQLTSRRRRIMGDQFKGRGMFLKIDRSRLLQDLAPSVRRAQSLSPGGKILLLEKTSNDGGKVVDRAWWPAERLLPEKLRAYDNRGEWQIRAVDGDQITIWRDYTKPERERMGEITDARYSIAKTYLMMAHDLAVGRFYRDIAGNDQWSREAEPSERWVDAADYNRFWSDESVEWVKVPDTTIPNSGGKSRWGALAGRFVRSEIWRDLNEIEALNRRGLWQTLLSQWKLNKTARNPVVHMNNIMSNMVLMDMADVRFTDLAAAAKSYLRKDDLWSQANRHGAFGVDMVSAEMRRDVLQPVLDEIAKQTPISVRNGGTLLAKMQAVLTIMSRKLEPLKRADQKMMAAYQLEDEVFRLALFKRRLDQGVEPIDAANEAREQFIDYDIRAPWVNAARRTVLPFVSYTYRAAPIIAKTVAGKPWKLAKYFAIAYGLNALAYAMLGDEGDEDKERGSLREQERGYAWIGVPRLLRLPFNRGENPVFLDIRRWIPGADVFDLNQGQSAIPIPAPLMPGGPITMAGEILLNKKMFDGKEIVNDKTDTPWESTGKVADYLWKSLAPSAPWIPGSWYWNKIGLAGKGAFGGDQAYDSAGNPLSLPEAVLQSTGVKVGARDVDFGYAMQHYALRSTDRELQMQERRLKRDAQAGRISGDTFEREMDGIAEKRRRLDEKADKISRTQSGQQ
ncbi:hypothetical protein [Ferrovibrio sp.]|uniref:hypothetical protein n=1 Tax=Ferrovibrio sp. TaxID=1917215 RepID=UPI00311F47F7